MHRALAVLALVARSAHAEEPIVERAAADAWGRRRGRVSFTGDVASRYRNVAVSIGLWH
ncbi:MAG TPA: hypothetical protein VM513_01220 [Kofleriaceae bacterium]|nr:hypothetical protein [Kofleriaceae bacterium]